MSNHTDDAVILAVEQKTVYFMNDELIAIRAEDSQIYVSVSHLSDAIGLDRQGQTQRIRRQPILLDGFRRAGIETSGGTQTAGMLRVDLIPLWLAGVNTGRITEEERRKKVERYQREAAKVLWEAFQEGRLSLESDFDEILQKSSSEAVEAYKMLQALVKLARNQIVLESRLDAHDSRLSVYDERLDEYSQRLEEVETTLGDPKHHITPEQASQISQAVKAVAHELGKKTKRNEYGGVYGELYRRYGINSYKELPANKFDDAMSWLNDWLQSLIDDVAF